MADTPELEHGDGHDVSPVGDIHSFPSDSELSRSLMASSAAGGQRSPWRATRICERVFMEDSVRQVQRVFEGASEANTIY